ncbi:MAG: sugar-binding protein [Clostridiales bacterium]|nr:sugar-binding protein [Clostridiales bacterium]
MKKTISLLLTLILCFGSCPVFAEDGDIPNAYTEDFSAYVDFADMDNPVNMEFQKYGMTETMVQGKKALTTVKSMGQLYIMFDVDDKLMYNLPEYTPMAVTIEYFDKGTGKFSLNYDSYHPQSQFWLGVDENGAAVENTCWRSAGTVELTNTNTWKTYTYYLEDMRLSNKLDKVGDFRIGIWDTFTGMSEDDVIFGNVKIERAEPQNPASTIYDFDKLGNIYEMTDYISFNQKTINKSEKNITVEYEYVYDADTQYYTKTLEKKEVKLAPGEIKEQKIELENPGIYGLYNITLNQTCWYDDNPEEKYTAAETQEFSVSKVTADEDRNPLLGTCYQLVGWMVKDIKEQTDLIKMAGMNVVRDEILWEKIEKEKGVLTFPDAYKNKLKEMKDNGIEPLLILCYYNQFYDNGKTPSSDEAIEAYANYCAFMVQELKGTVKYFEIWNEYNHSGFNNASEPPETYAKMLKAAYKKIKEVNPDAVVIGCDTASIDLEWIERVFEAGGYDYMDMVSVHPYDWSGEYREYRTVEEGLALKELMKKYGDEKPIWYTEGGFSTYMGGFTRVEQASNFVRFLAVMKMYDLADMFTQFQFPDRDRDWEQEYCWGLINWYDDKDNTPNAAKESFLAVNTMNEFCGKYADYVEHLQDGRIYAASFYNNKMKKNVLLLMSGEEEKEKSYSLGCQYADLYDMYGNKVDTLYSETGVFTIPVSQVPVYLIGDFTQLKDAAKSEYLDFGSVYAQATSNDEVRFGFTKLCDKNMNIKVIESKNITELENKGFVNNRAEVVLKTSENINSPENIRIIISDDEGNVYYNFEHRIEYKDPITVSVSSEQAVLNSNTHWRIRTEVVNNSNTGRLSGNVEIKEPKNLASYNGTKRFNDLMPGEKAVFLFNIPEQVTKKTIDLTVDTTLDSGYVDTNESKVEFISSGYAYEKPKIDGVIENGEWTGSWVGADEEKDVYMYSGEWKGPSDLSFSAITKWDEENFYFMATVTDDVHSAASEPSLLWQGDSIQLGFDDREFVDSLGNSAFTEIGLVKLSGGRSAAYRYKAMYETSSANITRELNEVEIEVKNYDTYTVYECAIPWKVIFKEDFVPDVSKPGRFSILVNDNDGNGRKGFMEYTSGIGQTKNALLFGKWNFVK